MGQYWVSAFPKADFRWNKGDNEEEPSNKGLFYLLLYVGNHEYARIAAQCIFGLPRRFTQRELGQASSIDKVRLRIPPRGKVEHCGEVLAITDQLGARAVLRLYAGES